SIFGIIGIMVGMTIIIIHLLSLESLGVPYSSPVSPLRISDLKDAFIRFPLKVIKKRPLSLQPKQVNQQGDMRERGDKK
ncbi:spore germination protein, partial [Bacillus cereus group sp. N18]